MMDTTDTTYAVDAKGLSCPMPLLKAKLALNRCAVGDTVCVQATDGGSVRDFRAFTELSSHILLRFSECTDDNGQLYYEYILQKG
ncbi:sulfurtransferase TusA family protein [Marinagarivorans algicola]|uniref:sulfurtransferase TusA family protein n=1 Tax=Marinagarivorans algicola TaxID=1513270 RepID=UPI0006B4C30A|nr:sulfurtransferase TusA family protein [Marinagarivorans algicola]